jgi:hypothetical protein
MSARDTEGSSTYERTLIEKTMIELYALVPVIMLRVVLPSLFGLLAAPSMPMAVTRCIV